MAQASAVPFRQPLLFQPFERRTPFSFAAVVDETRAAWFPELEGEIEARVAALSSLASVWFHRMGFQRHVVVFHPVLNRPDMPVEVVRFIAKHELTHLRVPLSGHPPEFWDAELSVGPERFAVWAWLHRNLSPPVRPTRWGTRVLRNWQRTAPKSIAPYTPHLPFDDVPWRVLCPEGGAQLRFAPAWAPTPLPFAGAHSIPRPEVSPFRAPGLPSALVQLWLEIEGMEERRELPGGGAALVAFMSFAVMRGFGGTHALIALADRLHDEHRVRMGPITTFYEAEAEDAEDREKLEMAWQEPELLRGEMEKCLNAFATDPMCETLARRGGAETLSAELSALEEDLREPAATATRIRLVFAL